MANMDSISIELTADVSSAESSINKLIGTLNRLKSAITGASSFEKVTRGIAGIAAVASGIDSNAGKKLSDLAAGIDALSKAGDVSHLKGAAKIISDLNNAMNGSGSASGLANGIREASNALGSINQADVDKLTAVRDALSGEVSGAMHQSASNENAMLGGMENASLVPLQEIADGFNYIEGQIVAATDAYYDFRDALTGGVNWTYGGGNNNGTWYADGVRDPSRSWANIFDSFPRALPGQVGTIETEFVNLSDASEVAAGSVIRLRGALGSIGGYIANDVKTVFSNIGGSIKGFASSVLRIAKYRIIRTMLKNISQGFTEGRENLYNWSAAVNGHFAKSMNNLATSTLYMKNALGTLVGPLMESLAPALNWIIERLVEAINYFNMFVAAISGKSTYTAAVKSATTWGNAVSNAAGNAKDKVDELKRTIMGFDEINKLDKISEGSGGTGGTGGSGGGGVAGMFEERELTGGFQEFSNALESALQDSLSRITLIIGAAELALGAILALSGANVGLGLGLMASGALAIGSAIVANWEGIPNELKLQIATIEAALASTLVLGAILAFSGAHIGLGIGLMAAALSAGFGAVTIAWNSIGDTLGEKIRAISVLVGGAAFGIGTVLTFAAHPEIGIPMMIAGASVAAISINWNYLEEKLKGPIGAVVALVSGASIVLGILAILGSNVPLGIGLILAGTEGLVSTVAANWDGLVKLGSDAIGKVKEGWETIKELAVTAWVALKKKVGEWADAVWNFLENGTETIVKTVSAVAGKIADFSGDVWNMVKAGSQTIAKKVTAAFEAIGEWTSNAWLAVQKGAETVAKKVTAAFETIGTWTSNAWLAVQKGAETVAKTITAAFSAIGEWTSNAWLAIQKGKETVAKKVTAAFEAIGEWTSNAWLAVQKGAETIAKTVTAGMTVLNTWSSSIVDFILGPEGSSKRTSIALSIVEEARQIINFLRDPVTGIKNIVIKITSEIESGLAAFLGINPSSDRENIIEEDASYTANIIANATVNANPGAGFSVGSDSSSWNLDQNIDGTVTLAPTPPATVAQTFKNAWDKLTASNKTVAAIADLVRGNWKNGFAKWIKDSKFGVAADFISNLVRGNWASGFVQWIKDNKFGIAADFISNLVRGNWKDGFVKWIDDNKWKTAYDFIANLIRGNWSKANGGFPGWIKSEKFGTTYDFIANLIRGNWSKANGGFPGWIKSEKFGTAFSFTANLSKGWTGTWKSALGIPDSPKYKILAEFKTSNGSDEIKVSSGGTSIGTMKLAVKALGGIFSNGIWKSIPQYAGGTTNAHGSLFLAGEAGPEIVGHVGGRTEVLNRSQLAATMYSAVNAAMSGVTLDANFGGGSVDSYETMYEAVYDAVTAAMSKSDDRDREKIALLRQLNQKEFSANISTGQINQAQRYANRRAGTTIVPVGT